MTRTRQPFELPAPTKGLNLNHGLIKKPRVQPKRHLLAMSLLGLSMMASTGVLADDGSPLLTPGDGVVTGFSGITPNDKAKGSPLDTFFIDLNGASAQVLSLIAMPGPANGTVDVAPVKRRITAAEVGQVFAVTLDDGTDGADPSIYLGQTAAFGINIVTDAGGGKVQRLRNGEAGARFMDGQLGPSGSPGSIWKVDGRTGAISEFAVLPDNSGAGVGDVVFDRSSGQFFASDLDNGLIYRIGGDGRVIDSFDHGITGRTAEGLAELTDDGARMTITDAAFDTEKTSTWGYTQAERMVSALAITDGRLYYATAGKLQIWSIAIGGDGSFGNDARLELDVDGLPGPGPITDMAFDAKGMMYLAQRGASKGAYNYAEFAAPDQSGVVRYAPSKTDGKLWEEPAEEYAIGMPPEHNASNGGIALGYSYDENGLANLGQCNGTLWTSGERLTSDIAEGDAADAKADVHGLQGNAVSMVRPDNTPPQQSYFLDYDGLLGDPEKAGHIGDIEVFQICDKSAKPYVPTTYPPGYLPPGKIPPTLPPEFPPPVEPFHTNLKLRKTATPETCSPWGAGWSCRYRVRVTNTGPDNYFGDIQIRDWLPTPPPGAFFGVSPMPPWTCWMSGAASFQCWRPGVFLIPGQSVSLRVFVFVPADDSICRLRNMAEIEWAPGGTQWNTDPTDDSDGATALVPNDDCDECPPGFINQDGECVPIVMPLKSNKAPPPPKVHRPVGSNVHRPTGSKIHRPTGSYVHRPVGSDVHRPTGSNIHRPIGSRVHRPRGSKIHLPIGSKVHRPRGSKVHYPIGSKVHRPRGSKIHLPIGSKVHRPKGSKIHYPIGSEIHLPIGSKVHRPKGSRVHRPRGSKVHLPRGSKVHFPKGSKIHFPIGSKVHRPKGSKIHLPIGSKVHRPKGSKVHLPRGSKVHYPKGSKVHNSHVSKIKQVF